MTTESLNYRSSCPLSAALDLIGDKWSLIIVRDMCMHKSKYGDFQNSPEGIPSNILANRLRQLESNGLIIKQPYQNKPVRYDYFLTRKGAQLLPVLQQLALWAHEHIPESVAPPAWFLDATAEDLLKTETTHPD